jgi:formylglycine-generating enzyme required for sulfatase activity
MVTVLGLLTAIVHAEGVNAGGFKDCDACPELVRIDPGVFQMGSPDDEVIASEYPAKRIALERPAHQVRIDYPFAIGRFEITIGEFALFAEATGFEATGCFTLTGGQWGMNPAASWRAPGFPVTDRSAATCLSYDDFAAYLGWLSNTTGESYRFPTEAEWEYAARSGLGEQPAPFSRGEQACGFLNGADTLFAKQFTTDWAPGLFPCDDGAAAGSAVGSYAPDQLGMHDVFGNMSEWTQDCAGSDHQGAPTDGSARVLVPCAARVLKGGSWAGGPAYLRPATRGSFPATLRGDGHGLRVLRVLRELGGAP